MMWLHENFSLRFKLVRFTMIGNSYAAKLLKKIKL